MDIAYNFLVDKIGVNSDVTFVVACSGGPDSMALLSLLISIKKKFDVKVVCAHVNHNVRCESEQEKDFVRDFCLSNSVIFEYMKIEEYNCDNFESEARDKRYDFFDKVVHKYNADYLLTAHHGDDLMETILMRIVRGSTLRGYSGFSKITDRGDYKILRPFINMTKKEIIDYDDVNNIEYVIDKTNFDDVHTRNRYRKYVIPKLKDEDMRVNDKFYKFSRILIECNDYIDRQALRCINDVVVDNTLKIDVFLELDYVIQTRIIYILLEHIYLDRISLISDKHVKLILELIKSDKANSSIDLPGLVRVIKEYNRIIFDGSYSECESYNIQIDNLVKLPNGMTIQVVDDTELTDNNIIGLNRSDVCFPLFVRSRMAGDSISVKGLNGSKKIKDIFIDSKIPVHERELWPVVVDSNNVIVWVPGIKKSKFDKQKCEKCDIILKYY